MELSSLNLFSLQTPYMQNDRTTKGLCTALQKQFLQLADEVRTCLILSRIDELDEGVIDELAWQLHVDFYEAVSLEQKRSLVKSAFIIHKTKGTPYAVETLIKEVFGDGAVQEWFEYGGEPFMFKVITTNPSVNQEQTGLFLKALDSVKNARSHLQEIIISLSGEMPFYFAGVVHTGDFLEIRQVV